MNRPSSQLCSAYERALTLLLAACLLLAIPGCITTHPRPSSPTTVIAKWTDVDAAVRVGVKRAEMAILNSQSQEPGQVVYHLRTITDEPASITIQASDPKAPSPQPLTLTASVGRFGNPAWESRLLTIVSNRLNQLATVDHAPLN